MKNPYKEKHEKARQEWFDEVETNGGSQKADDLRTNSYALLCAAVAWEEGKQAGLAEQYNAA